MHIQRGCFSINLIVFKHRIGVKNVVVKALSTRTYVLTILKIVITSFDTLPEQYAMTRASILYGSNVKSFRSTRDFTLHNVYLFKGVQLYILDFLKGTSNARHAYWWSYCPYRQG